MKNLFNRIFIEGLGGMALGLFATLIIGTILQQIGLFVPGKYGEAIYVTGKVAASVTGAGIGCGVAYRLKESSLVVLSAAVTGMVGAFASKILAGAVLTDGVIAYSGPGEPLGAFIAAYVGIEAGRLISGRTSLDILLTPLVSIVAGSAAGFLIGPPVTRVMNAIGNVINWGMEQQPLFMGIIVAVVMGMALTLPISSAALGIILNLSGLAAGAAVVGCCANMIGFAAASYRDNRMGGFLAQGLGTSMLQIPNIMKKPVIWLPAIITSAILGPVGACLAKLTCNAAGCGMGTSGLVGPIMTYQTMVSQHGAAYTMIVIVLLLFVLPALLSWQIAEVMRKMGWIKNGDMKIRGNE